MGIAVDAKVTSKGQVTIPAEIRRALGVGEGDRIEFFVHRDGQVLLQRRDGAPDAIFGRLRDRKPAVASDDEAVAAEIAARDDRSRHGRR